MNSSSVARHRLALLSRAAAAIVGGYALASAFAMLLSAVLPLPAAESVLLSIQLGFVVHAVAAMAVFAFHDLRRIWAALLGAAALMAGLGWLLSRGAA